MNLTEYQQSALRTESHVSTIEINKRFILNLLYLQIYVAEILDGVKKQIFYNNSQKLNEKFDDLVEDAYDYLDQLRKYVNGPKEKLNVDPRIFHGIIGVATESGELSSALFKYITTGEVDSVNIAEELTDDNWYQAILNDALNIDWEDRLQKNIDKLRARFPHKFTEEHAVNRDLDKERKILEGMANE